MKVISIVLMLALSAFNVIAEDWDGYAAPSVHLVYDSATSQYKSFTNSVTPTISAPGTYFMVAGWSEGYFGIQEKADSSKVIIFSVWDNSYGRAKVVYKAAGVTAGRFGGEGTGAQSFYNYNWSLNSQYSFRVTAAVVAQRTEFSGWFNQPGSGWKKLITMSVPTNGRLITDLYSFVEDFYRDGVGPEWTHKALFGPASVSTLSGLNTVIKCARFDTDGNSDPRVDAGTSNNSHWYLATGGATQNSTVIGASFCVP